MKPNARKHVLKSRHSATPHVTLFSFGVLSKTCRLPLEALLPSRWTSWEFAIQRNRTTDCRGQVHLGQWQNSCDWKMSVAEQLRVWFRMMGLHIEILQVSHFEEDISPFRKVDSARQNHTLRIISCLPIHHFLGVENEAAMHEPDQPWDSVVIHLFPRKNVEMLYSNSVMLRPRGTFRRWTHLTFRKDGCHESMEWNHIDVYVYIYTYTYCIIIL